MSLESTDIRVSFAGNGVTLGFTFNKYFLLNADLVVLLVDSTTKVETLQVITTNYTVSGAGESGGGTVTFLVAPPTGTTVVIYRDPAVTQTWDPEVTGPVPPDTIEQEFDKRTMVEQRLKYLAGRSVRLPEGHTGTFDTKLPADFEAGDVLTINEAGDGIGAKTPAELLAEAAEGGAIPVGGDTGAVLVKASADDQDTEWNQFDFEGYSARFGENISTANLQETLETILDLQYTGPAVSLSASGSGTIREKGDEVTASTLTAVITKRSDPIAEVRFYLGAGLLDTQTSGGGIPSGGNSTFNWTGSIDDTSVFSVQVDDDGATGGPTTASDTETFTFVYPYYVGAGAVALSAANVALLTKRVIVSSSSRNETITAANGNVFFFAYPASYGALVSILDENGFETFPDWTLRTENITGLDGNAVSYRIYEFENPVTAGDYEYTFVR
jgi:hypothetical protein